MSPKPAAFWAWRSATPATWLKIAPVSWSGPAACLALGEYLELTSNIVLDLDSAMPGILKGMEHVNAK